MATATTTKTKTKATKKTRAKKATKKRATPKKNLVIVESPAKAKTIEKYLGRNYKVVASVGHIRDLKKSSMSIDFENNYEPQYINIRGKGPLIKELKKEAKKAKKVFLASDPDREGEAISWHLSHILGLEPEDKNRVVFNEITKDAVKNAFAEPRAIDMDLVDAQQARRVLDRIVGYSISPLLWKKVKKGLSAGRVQSVALKLLLTVRMKSRLLNQKNIGQLMVPLRRVLRSFRLASMVLMVKSSSSTIMTMLKTFSLVS